MGSWNKGVDVIVFGTLISRERFLCELWCTEEKLKMPLGIKAVFLCLTAHNFLLPTCYKSIYRPLRTKLERFFCIISPRLNGTRSFLLLRSSFPPVEVVNIVALPPRPSSPFCMKEPPLALFFLPYLHGTREPHLRDARGLRVCWLSAWHGPL